MQLDISLEQVNVARLDSTTRRHYFVHHLHEMSQHQTYNADGNRIWIKSHYYDEVDMVENLSTGIHYQHSYFSEEIAEESFSAFDADHPIKHWDHKNKCQFYHEQI